MLDYTEQRRIIETEIENNFSTCQVNYENVGVPPGGEAVAWISVMDKANFSDATGIGETSFLIGGNLIIGIFTPKGTGTEQARSIAQELSDLLANKELGGITLNQPEFHGSPGVDKDSPWYQMNLIIPYVAIMGQSIEC